MKHTGKILSLVFINCIPFLLVIILVEGAFRVIGIPYKVRYIPNENSFSKFDPELGWSSISTKTSVHNEDHKPKIVHFDENGIRIPYQGFKFNDSQPSILFIGGSFTMGHGLTYEESFVGKLSSSGSVPYQIVNLGVQGYGSDQALLTLKRYLSKFNTKIVVYTFIEDHIYRNGNFDRRMLVPTARFIGTKPQFALNSNRELYLAKKPRLYNKYIQSYLIDFLKMRIGTLLGSFPPYPEELTKAIIREMKKYSNEHGAHFVVLNWRWSHDNYNELFHDLVDIDIIDTMKDAPEGWGEMRLYGGIHPNEEAGDHAAELLINYFQKNLF